MELTRHSWVSFYSLRLESRNWTFRLLGSDATGDAVTRCSAAGDELGFEMNLSEDRLLRSSSTVREALSSMEPHTQGLRLKAPGERERLRF